MKNIDRYQHGFLNLPNDNMFKTLSVAILLCLVCSILVSTSATLLKPAQVANKLLDKKKNILAVSGITGEGTIEELFARVEAKVVDMESGNYTDQVNAATFDQRRAANDPLYRVDLSKEQDIAQIGGRSKYASVYLVKNDDAVEKYILPIKGYGLWSTLYGFIALESDGTTVSGITFYEHKETPGLGGEIDNPKWQASWKGKHLTNPQGETVLQVVKGQVDLEAATAPYQIDGLAGATLTSNGVTNMIKYWLGENGFGPYLDQIRGTKRRAGVEIPSTSDLRG